MAGVNILVAHADAARRREIAAALHDAGYSCVEATQGEEALRLTAAMNPRLVIADGELEGIPAIDVHRRLKATGLSLPPFLVLSDDPMAVLGELPPDSTDELYPIEALGDPAELVARVRLLLLAAELGGEVAGDLEMLHGDLARTPVADLLRAAQRHVITGRLAITQAVEAGVWLGDGDIVEAWWGESSGRKAFNRVADLRRGAFQLTLQTPPVERSLDADLGTLVGDAVEERLQLEDLLEQLPPLTAKPKLRLLADLFSQSFTPVEQRVLARAQEVASLGELLDRVAFTDVEVARAVTGLRERGLLELEEPADRVHVVTDSTADMLPSEARRAGITIVPVSILFGTEVYKDGVDLQPDDFDRKLRETREPPVTNPATRGELLETYRRLVPTGDIVSVHGSPRLSETVENARAAVTEGAEDLRSLRQQEGSSAVPRILVVDVGQASAPLGMLTGLAARLARAGLTAPEVARMVDELGRRTHTFLLARNLEYLERSRMKPAGVAFSQGQRPILAVTDGRLQLADQTAGGPGALLRLMELFEERIDPVRPVLGVVVHASAPALAADLRSLLEGRLSILELSEHQMGPAVTCHIGPGAVGAGLVQPTEDELELLR